MPNIVQHSKTAQERQRAAERRVIALARLIAEETQSTLTMEIDRETLLELEEALHELDELEPIAQREREAIEARFAKGGDES